MFLMINPSYYKYKTMMSVTKFQETVPQSFHLPARFNDQRINRPELRNDVRRAAFEVTVTCATLGECRNV